jgi:hypothetical protein
LGDVLTTILLIALVLLCAGYLVVETSDDNAHLDISINTSFIETNGSTYSYSIDFGEIHINESTEPHGELNGM